MGDHGRRPDRHGRATGVVLTLTLVGALLVGCSSTPDVVDFGAVPGPGQPQLPADRGLRVTADPADAPALGTVLGDGGWDAAAAFVARNAAEDRPTLINLFASWCGPCEREMPLLNATADAEPELVFLGVAHLDARPDAERFVTEQQITFTTLLDLDGEVAAAVGGRGLPVTVVFDRVCEMVASAFGYLCGRSLDELIALVR
jgi:thiol-disulfide isomerase/thioredoxin